MYQAIGASDRLISRHLYLSRAALAVALEGQGRVEKEGGGSTGVTDVVDAVREVLDRWDTVAFLQINNGHWTVRTLDEMLSVIRSHGAPSLLHLMVGMKMHKMPQATVDALVTAAESSVVRRVNNG